MIAILFSQWTGFTLFQDRLFRAGGGALFAFFVVFILMPWWIRFLSHRKATADFDKNADSFDPPVFGGALLVGAVIISTLIFSRLNSYVLSVLAILISYSLVGFVDDWRKVLNKKQIEKGDGERKSYQDKADGISAGTRLFLYFLFSVVTAILAYFLVPGLDGRITIPFIKPQIWDPVLPGWLFVCLMSFVITATANGANFTDGMDTLVSIPLITMCTFVGMVAYIASNLIFSSYLLLPHLPGVDEILPICTSIAGAMLAYLWFNSPPAQIYMGDGGSIGFGGAIGLMFILVKAELFVPLVGVVFLLEAVSVVLQIGYFKWTRKVFGEGKRIFLRAPIHDHFFLSMRKKYPFLSASNIRSKIVWRFHLISVISLILGALIFFKVR